MDIAASLLTFMMFWKLSWSLHCFRCDPEHTSRACTKFDYSDKFLVECEHSTMCVKKVTSLQFSDGLTSQSIERGCASQVTNGEQRKINGKWRAVQNIYEVYDEACSEDPGVPERTTKTLHCYCRGDRCNSAQKIFTSVLVMSVCIIVEWCVSMF